ncbi:MAG: UV DNA damage repair endonuclease UvsE [Candidatus Theseobacter exili]|nr:UV DNA damage repair endonuclease UvsE [Candidatus Theseobacter exili]
MIRLGLCCKLFNEPIKFHTTTARYLSGLSSAERENKISGLCLHNAKSLLSAIRFCHQQKIGSFRINSRILPLKTHPDFGYDIMQIDQASEIVGFFEQCAVLAKQYNIRLTFHPDQFVLLSSPNIEITRKSIEELEYQAEICELVGADVINIHGGGAYGNKKSALNRVTAVLKNLSDSVRTRLTFENDDRIYCPKDLLPFCEENDVPFVYDVHHHRCLEDGLFIEEVTDRAIKTWDREPLFHISSPKYGWDNGKTNLHHDYINFIDFPDYWKALNITVEIEAKAKELAVVKMQKYLKQYIGV